ncbi:MAG: hypothetical protein NE328_23460 [Lentisphaeraceae bacterium]|nr:hypothetical protein [Lentisphaeraceae bacterium]
MEKVVRYAEDFNYKAFIVNIGILAFYTVFSLFKLLGNMGNMPVTFFLHSFAILAASVIGGVVFLATTHLVLWCSCDYYRKAKGASKTSSTPVKTEEKAEEKKED